MLLLLSFCTLQEDLFNLRVTNEVHHVSIKRGIQILRLNNFNPNCLRRRPAPDEVCCEGLAILAHYCHTASFAICKNEVLFLNISASLK